MPLAPLTLPLVRLNKKAHYTKPLRPGADRPQGPGGTCPPSLRWGELGAQPLGCLLIPFTFCFKIFLKITDFFEFLKISPNFLKFSKIFTKFSKMFSKLIKIFSNNYKIFRINTISFIFNTQIFVPFDQLVPKYFHRPA